MHAKSSRVLLPVLLLAVLLLSGSAQALEPYDVTIRGASFEPGTAVNIDITGLVNQTISIRITGESGDILSGRDTQTNSTGGYTFNWVPSQEGTFNVTVVFSTGITITKSFLVQNKVTDEDIAQLYLTIFGIRDRIDAALEDLRTLINIVLLLSGVAIVLSVTMVLYLRKNISHMETDFEKAIKAWASDEMGTAFKKVVSENANLRNLLEKK